MAMHRGSILHRHHNSTHRGNSSMSKDSVERPVGTENGHTTSVNIQQARVGLVGRFIVLRI